MKKRSDFDQPFQPEDSATNPPQQGDANTPDLNEIQAERDQYLDQLQRSMAEFANYRRRVDQERSVARQIATRDLLLRLLPIVDDFHRAFEAIPDEYEQEPWVEGMALIERNLRTLLEKEGVRPIDALGQPFDPALHEAVAVVPGSTGNVVVDVYQAGYWHGDQVLRPAMVQVGDPVEKSEREGEPVLNA